MGGKKTGAVFKITGIPIANLLYLIASGKIPPPAKDSAGQYLWSQADIDAAVEAVKCDRRLKANKREAVYA
jgi:DNA-binding transcriptional MerR regulator